jgi:hypothetical protein
VLVGRFRICAAVTVGLVAGVLAYAPGALAQGTKTFSGTLAGTGCTYSLTAGWTDPTPDAGH